MCPGVTGPWVGHMAATDDTTRVAIVRKLSRYVRIVYVTRYCFGQVPVL